MYKMIKNWVHDALLDDETKERIESAPINLNSTGFDPWGLDPETVKTMVGLTKWLYTDYFRVETTGIENVPSGRCLVIANHGGQLPVDGMVISMALLLEADPPRVVRGMVERWVPTLPFVSTLFNRMGQLVGDPKNCRELLMKDECVMVFPEGVGGSGKLISDRYQLQRFGSGFLRLALQTNTPIVPVSVIGSEETYPALFNLKPLAKLIKAPYFPVTPTFPALGALGAIPLPCKVTLRFSPPMNFEGDPDMSESEAQVLVQKVKDQIQDEINIGLKIRGEKYFTGSAVDPGNEK